MAGVRPDVHGFWEADGATKTFTHSLDPGLLAAHIPPTARVLDYGCGYGRLTARLGELGYAHVVGVDPARAMIERGRRENPRLALYHQPELPLPERDGAFDAALLFAVLTCVPDDAAQGATLAELARVVRPGGALYVSEVPLQRDARNVARYERYHASVPGSAYGTFTTDDGGLFRHLPADRLRALLRDHGFRVAEERVGTAPTLSGHRAECLQLVARRSADG
ncbi:class I SAM-dependent methyltransferase [Streptomyces spirodelae]|uniref:Class I SAM-dependent methyltransferase n=1 Tax=Streptomyces spirodelae TaxID=2812904 RepID=A0ABS3WZR2_9ACTN|nr:class I SAM-dependent methyltransferase [Streptomyces spirodelae]MBO8188331.1 class I SAM-dependent methyltransferase [Streptomyces spirodelae]